MNKIIDDYLLEATRKRGTMFINVTIQFSVANRAYIVLV